MKKIFFLFFVTCISINVNADESSPLKIKIEEYGLYSEGKSVGRQEEAGSSSGSVGVIDAVEGPTLLKKTDKVKMGVGVRFGLTFSLVGRKPFDIAPVKVRVIHPAFDMPDGKTVTVDEWDAGAQGIPRFTGWLFEHPWELVPGLWKIQICKDGQVLAEQSFHIE